jgi:hypothetical protein
MLPDVRVWFSGLTPYGIDLRSFEVSLMGA